MELVQPIRDIKHIEAMKKVLRLDFYGLRNVLLFTLGINSGLRISDLLNLRWRDLIDLGKPVDRIVIRESKTGKAKDFPVGRTSAKAIRDYYGSIITTMDSYVFASKKGGRITRQAAWRILNEAAEAVGIKEAIGTHTLRKTFGYHAYQQGKDVAMVQKLLNHSSPGVTLRYIGITQEALDDVYLTLNL